MIHYALRCGGGHEFDGWFKSSSSFDAQAGAGLLDCPACGSNTVTRALMAPRISAIRATPAAQHPGGQHSGGQHSGGQHSGGQHSGGQHSGGQHSGSQHSGSQYPGAQPPAPVSQGAVTNGAAPHPAGAQAAPQAAPPSALPDQLRAVLQRIRTEVEKTCEYVGPNFAREVRRMAADETQRPVYGEATPDEAAALIEDGIDVARIPWVPRADS